jgi:hypothetical protein
MRTMLIPVSAMRFSRGGPVIASGGGGAMLAPACAASGRARPAASARIETRQPPPVRQFMHQLPWSANPRRHIAAARRRYKWRDRWRPMLADVPCRHGRLPTAANFRDPANEPAPIGLRARSSFPACHTLRRMPRSGTLVRARERVRPPGRVIGRQARSRCRVTPRSRLGGGRGRGGLCRWRRLSARRLVDGPRSRLGRRIRVGLGGGCARSRRPARLAFGRRPRGWRRRQPCCSGRLGGARARGNLIAVPGRRGRLILG